MSVPELPHFGWTSAAGRPASYDMFAPELPHSHGPQRRKGLQPTRGMRCTNAYDTQHTQHTHTHTHAGPTNKTKTTKTTIYIYIGKGDCSGQFSADDVRGECMREGRRTTVGL